MAVAKLLVPRKPGEALQWVERGCALDREKQSGVAYELERLHRGLLTKLGRQDEAREAVWTDFLRHPSRFTYQDLMRIVPRLERKEWHEKALDAAATGADLGSLLELFTWTKETERLVKLVRRYSDEALEKSKPPFHRAGSEAAGEEPSRGFLLPPLVRTRNAYRGRKEE